MQILGFGLKILFSEISRAFSVVSIVQVTAFLEPLAELPYSFFPPNSDVRCQ